MPIAMQHAPNMHAADQLHQVQLQLAQLQRSEQHIREQLSGSTSRAAAEISRSGNLSTEPGRNFDRQALPELLRETLVLESGLQYVGKLEVCLAECGFQPPCCPLLMTCPHLLSVPMPEANGRNFIAARTDLGFMHDIFHT